jgi:hypothetical protein
VSLLAQKKNNNQARLHHCGAKSFRGYSNGVIAPLYSLRLLPRVKTRGYKYEIPPGLTTQKKIRSLAQIYELQPPHPRYRTNPFVWFSRQANKIILLYKKVLILVSEKRIVNEP